MFENMLGTSISPRALVLIIGDLRPCLPLAIQSLLRDWREATGRHGMQAGGFLLKRNGDIVSFPKYDPDSGSVIIPHMGTYAALVWTAGDTWAFFVVRYYSITNDHLVIEPVLIFRDRSHITTLF